MPTMPGDAGIGKPPQPKKGGEATKLEDGPWKVCAY